MQLPKELIEELTLSPDSSAASRDPEKRKNGRISWPRQVVLIPLRDGIPQDSLRIRTREISRSGIGFLHHWRMTPGEEFVIGLPRKREKPVWVQCAAKRTQSISRDLFMVGASFVKLVLPPQRPATPAPAAPPKPLDAPETSEADRIRRAILS